MSPSDKPASNIVALVMGGGDAVNAEQYAGVPLQLVRAQRSEVDSYQRVAQTL